MVRHRHYNELREVAPHDPLTQGIDWAHMQLSTSPYYAAMELIDMCTVAPHSWFNMQLNIFLYKYDDIPEELVMTHHLNDDDPSHSAILAKQKVMRRGPHNHMFGEHFYLRYFDYKYKKQSIKFTEDQVKNMCIGTELYVMFLLVAGLIKAFDDTMQDDPYKREGVKVLLI